MSSPIRAMSLSMFVLVYLAVGCIAPAASMSMPAVSTAPHSLQSLETLPIKPGEHRIDMQKQIAPLKFVVSEPSATLVPLIRPQGPGASRFLVSSKLVPLIRYLSRSSSERAPPL